MQWAAEVLADRTAEDIFLSEPTPWLDNLNPTCLVLPYQQDAIIRKGFPQKWLLEHLTRADDPRLDQKIQPIRASTFSIHCGEMHDLKGGYRRKIPECTAKRSGP